jgi:nucleotidyltransferase/DNA polymerase involved in DNA repair
MLAMSTQSVIGHFDADSFYVAAESVRNRFLCGKPVGALGTNRPI